MFRLTKYFVCLISYFMDLNTKKIIIHLIDIKMQYIVANTGKYLHNMSLDKSEHIYMITSLDAQSSKSFSFMRLGESVVHHVITWK